MARIYRKKGSGRRKAQKRKPQKLRKAKSPFDLLLATNKNFTETNFHIVTGKKAKGIMNMQSRKWYPKNACGLEELKRDIALGYIK